MQQQLLSPQEIHRFKSMGYSDAQINEAIRTASNQYTNQDLLDASYSEAMESMQTDPRTTASTSLITSGYNENLIQWQLELDSILERIEHLLRGDRPTFQNGSIMWSKPTNPEDETFNDHGVTEIMKVLSSYVNRNTILSNYSEKTIEGKCYNLGIDLSDLIYLKYERMGMDTVEKRKKYPIIVRQIVDMVHSAYLRSLNGGERESLREARQVTQTEGLHPAGQYPSPVKERSILSPLRWFGGKYK